MGHSKHMETNKTGKATDWVDVRCEEGGCNAMVHPALKVCQGCYWQRIRDSVERASQRELCGTCKGSARHPDPNAAASGALCPSGCRGGYFLARKAVSSG